MSEHPHDDEPIEVRVVQSGDSPLEGWIDGCKAFISAAVTTYAEVRPLPAGTVISVDAHVKIEVPGE